MLGSVKDKIYQTGVKFAADFVPTLLVSKFLEEGVLTPEEFVAAGDLLVFKCPTWSWESGDPKKASKDLPKEKQFLITRNVPCSQRAENLGKGSIEKSVSMGGGEDDWTELANAAPGEKDDDLQDISSPKPSGSNIATGDEDDDDDDGDAPDMEAFNEANLEETPDSATLPGDNIERSRTYDISITYDRFYQTPKVWLFGYDENRQPLKPVQIFQDISQDHAHKTVTMDTHPFLSISFAFIHPCRHAQVMKKIIQRLLENGRQPRIDQYLFLFLKFISAVIPTIEYDYTLEIDV